MAEEIIKTDISQELNFWGARVFQRIIRNFSTLDINQNPGEKGDRFSGRLRRSIWWTVHNAAGGNQAMIDFFFLNYADFLQWGVGGGQKAWSVPPMHGMKAMQAPNSKRKAKPFLRSEIRHHLKWLQRRLAEQYAYNGAFYIVKGISDGMGDKSITERWVREHEKELAQGLQRVMYINPKAE